MHELSFSLIIISILFLYSSIFLFRTFIALRLGKNYFRGFAPDKNIFRWNLSIPANDVLFFNNILYAILWFIVSMPIIGIIKWLFLISFIVALLLARYTKKDDIEYLIINYNIPFYGIKWKKNNIIKIIDRCIIISGFTLLIIGSII